VRHPDRRRLNEFHRSIQRENAVLELAAHIHREFKRTPAAA
jgi:hypothetical protein